jgi:hypothetical protein
VIYDPNSKARFLLMHDPEFTATGAETKINYHADYDFYLERLFKHTPWARSVINYFNKEVFDVTSSSLAPAPNSPSITAQTQTWEDDLLDELDAPAQVTSALTSIPATSAVVNVVSNYHTSISVNQGHTTASELIHAPEPTNSPEPEVEAPKHVTHHSGSSKAVTKPRGQGRANANFLANINTLYCYFLLLHCTFSMSSESLCLTVSL